MVPQEVSLSIHWPWTGNIQDLKMEAAEGRLLTGKADPTAAVLEATPARSLSPQQDPASCERVTQVGIST